MQKKVRKNTAFQITSVGFASKLFCLFILFSLFTCPGSTLAKGEFQNLPDSFPIKEETIDGKVYDVTKIIIKAKPERVFQTVTDYPNHAKLFPLMSKSQIVQDKGATKIVSQTVKPTGVFTTFSYILEMKESKPNRVEWKRLSGSMKDVRGFWKLESLDGGKTTLLTYGSYVDGGMLIPRPLLKRQFKLDIPGSLTALKNHLETKRIAEAEDSSVAQ